MQEMYWPSLEGVVGRAYLYYEETTMLEEIPVEEDYISDKFKVGLETNLPDFLDL